MAIPWLDYSPVEREQILRDEVKYVNEISQPLAPLVNDAVRRFPLDPNHVIKDIVGDANGFWLWNDFIKDHSAIIDDRTALVQLVKSRSGGVLDYSDLSLAFELIETNIESYVKEGYLKRLTPWRIPFMQDVTTPMEWIALTTALSFDTVAFLKGLAIAWPGQQRFVVEPKKLYPVVPEPQLAGLREWALAVDLLLTLIGVATSAFALYDEANRPRREETAAQRLTGDWRALITVPDSPIVSLADELLPIGARLALINQEIDYYRTWSGMPEQTIDNIKINNLLPSISRNLSNRLNSNFTFRVGANSGGVLMLRSMGAKSETTLDDGVLFPRRFKNVAAYATYVRNHYTTRDRALKKIEFIARILSARESGTLPELVDLLKSFDDVDEQGNSSIRSGNQQYPTSDIFAL